MREGDMVKRFCNSMSFTPLPGGGQLLGGARLQELTQPLARPD